MRDNKFASGHPKCFEPFSAENASALASVATGYESSRFSNHIGQRCGFALAGAALEPLA
jgi:hypothetical protein